MKRIFVVIATVVALLFAGLAGASSAAACSPQDCQPFYACSRSGSAVNITKYAFYVSGGGESRCSAEEKKRVRRQWHYSRIVQCKAIRLQPDECKDIGDGDVSPINAPGQGTTRSKVTSSCTKHGIKRYYYVRVVQGVELFNGTVKKFRTKGPNSKSKVCGAPV